MASTTTTSGGTISVPLSSILDALGNTLNEAERATLLEKLIGLRATRVQPGDLISSALFNQMLGDIEDLAIRVAGLEGTTGGPVIDLLDPAGTVAVNRRLTVTGRNFNPEPSLNVVKLGDIAITQFRSDSSPTQLAFAVPDMFASLPVSVPVRVETGGRTSNAIPITIKAEEKIQAGSFNFGPATVSPAGAVAVGATLRLSWTIQAMTVFEDNVALAAVVVQPQGANESAWRSNLAILPGPSLPILAGQTKTVTVSVTVPTGATSVRLGLRATSSDQRVTNTSDLVTVQVGVATETSDSRIDMTFGAGGDGVQAGPVTIEGTSLPGVHVRPGGSGVLAFSARDTRPTNSTPKANFDFSAQFEGPANGFVIGAPIPQGVVDVDAGDDRDFVLEISAPQGAAVNSTARLKVKCSQTKTAGLGTYAAFRTIPLKITS